MSYRLQNKFYMVDKRSNMQLADIKSNPRGGKILIDISDRAIGVRVYPPSGSEHYKLLRLDRLHGSTCHQKPLHDKHSKIMRREALDVYNVLYPDFSGTLSTKIFSATTYT